MRSKKCKFLSIQTHSAALLVRAESTVNLTIALQLLFDAARVLAIELVSRALFIWKNNIQHMRFFIFNFTVSARIVPRSHIRAYFNPMEKIEDDTGEGSEKIKF